MEYTLLELNTDEALRISYDLSNLEICEQLTFKAKLKWVRPFGMLFTAISIRQMRDSYKDTDVKFNMDITPSLNGIAYASHMGFFRTISEKIKMGKMPGEAKGNNNYIPITKLDFSQMYDGEIAKGNYVVMGDVIEKEASKLAKILSREDKEMHILLTYLIREILRNIPEHANVKQAWVCGQYWEDETAEIAIVDEGIGIKESLRKNRIHKEYIETDAGLLPNDYKIYCFNGEPKLTLVCTERSKEVKMKFMDLNWNEMNIGNSDFLSKEFPVKPECFDEMIEICRNISKPFPFVRIDFYDLNGKPVLGEMTFTPAGCAARYYNQEGLNILGNMICLPEKYKEV